MQRKSNIYGLVLTGGYSSRMGKDKAMINYHGIPQFNYLFQLLQPFCEKVFLSCRQEQSIHFGEQYPVIIDLYEGIGPMNGLLSFFEKYGSRACLVIACDMPLIDEAIIQLLIQNRQSDKIATAFMTKKGFPEPLLTIWEPDSYPALKTAFKDNNYSLRDILQNNDCRLIKTNDEKKLLNINKPDELEAILKTLHLPPEKM